MFRGSAIHANLRRPPTKNRSSTLPNTRSTSIEVERSGNSAVRNANTEKTTVTTSFTDVACSPTVQPKKVEQWMCVGHEEWGSLPQDILQAITKHLPRKATLTLRLVNRHWSIAGRLQITGVIIDTKHFVEHWNLGGYLSRLADGTYCNLRQLKLRTPFHDGLENLKRLTALTTLDITGCATHSQQLSGIGSLMQLSALAMGWTYLADEGSRNLSGLTLLTALSLEWTHISEVTLKQISGLTKLTRLNICGMSWSSNDCLAPLKTHKALTFLDLSWIYLSDNTLAPISSLTNLTHLNLTMNPLSNTAMNRIEGLTQLRILNLKKTNVGNEGLRRLTPLMRLRELNLSGTAVEDRGLQLLTHLALLSSLDLSDNLMIGWDSLEHLMPLTSLGFLQHLHLQRTQANPSTAKSLAMRFLPKKLRIEC